MTPVMLAVASTRRTEPRAYPLLWNTTSTLGAATNAQYFYDYAGQDPNNNYDLAGTCYGAKSANAAENNINVYGSRYALCLMLQRLEDRCAANNRSRDPYTLAVKCYGKAAAEACAQMSGDTEGCIDTIWGREKEIHYSGSLIPDAVLQAGAACVGLGSWGAEWGTATFIPYASVAGAVGGCVIGGVSDWFGGDVDAPEWKK